MRFYCTSTRSTLTVSYHVDGRSRNTLGICVVLDQYTGMFTRMHCCPSQLSEIAERILGMSSRGERVLDSFLASVDRNIEDSRNVMR